MKYAVLVLTGSYRETGIQTHGLSTAAGKEGFRFDHFYLKTEALIKKRKVQKVLIECRQDFSAGVFSGLEEICERIEVLKQNGKEVFFHAASYGVQELYLAAACSYRLIHPMGTLRFFGVSQSFVFASRLMRRIGIDSEVVRRGRYKSAGDLYRTDYLEDPTREQYERFLNSAAETLRNGIISGFGKTSEDLSTLENGLVLTAGEAADSSWIDEIVTLSDFKGRWEDQKDREFSFRKIPSKTGGRGLLPKKQVAVLVFEGAIVDGKSRRDPMMGQAVGAESFIPHIRKLRESKKVKAVVLRINSGGGSAFASEDIASELRLLSDEKPVIVSMSEVAGSGGYWISCCGKKTFALPTTLTGSIGVISIYLNWYRLLENAGITFGTIKTGEFADTGSPFRKLTEKEKQIIETDIDNMYRSFLSMAAEFRDMPEEQLNAVAQGRIWSGTDAAERGLVDAEGGLNAAIAEAAEAAGSVPGKVSVRFYPEVRHGLAERLIMNMTKGDDESAEAVRKVSGMMKILTAAAVNTGPLALMEEAIFRWN